jgi:hypothetical protein
MSHGVLLGGSFWQNRPSEEDTSVSSSEYIGEIALVTEPALREATARSAVSFNFKSVERIEAFLFFYFVAVLLHALIERHVRTAMKQRDLRSIPLYPEGRKCSAPTADKILALFEPLRRHRLLRRDKLVETFYDELSDIQRLVLELLDIDPRDYGDFAC